MSKSTLNRGGLLWVLAFMLLLSACSGDSAESDQKATEQPEIKQTEPAAPPEPITLRMLNHVPAVYDETFNEILARKFPHITFDWVMFRQLPANERSLEHLIVSNNVPDLFITASNSVDNFQTTELLYDMRELIRQNNFDLTRLDSVALASVASYGSKGELFALPFYINYGNLFYNKDLFDRFGVQYPPDGMTWDEAIQLAKKLTHTENGVEYKGFDYVGARFIAGQLSLSRVDPSTNKATLDTAGYRKVMQVVSGFAQNGNPSSGTLDTFVKGQKVAMALFRNGGMITQLKNLESSNSLFNWDVTTLPVFADGPKSNMDFDAHILMISPLSKHSQAAFHVIEHILSDAVQLELTRSGVLTALNNSGIKNQFAADLSLFKGKNIAGMFAYQPAPMIPPSKFHGIGDDFFKLAEQAIANGEKDINTALREANEATNQAIASMNKQ